MRDAEQKHKSISGRGERAEGEGMLQKPRVNSRICKRGAVRKAKAEVGKKG